MEYSKYINLIKELQDSPVYLLIGKDDYLLNLTIDSIFAKSKKKSGGIIEKHVFFSDSASAKDALLPLENRSFFASSSFVVIHDIDKYGAKDTDILSSYIQRPEMSSILVLTAESIDKRKSFYKNLQKAKTEIIELKPTTESELPGWIRAIASNRGKKITADAIEKLCIRIGGNLGIAAMEIKKLISFAGKDEQIEARHVEELVGRSRVDSAFDLTNAISERNITKSLSIIKSLFDEGENEIGMIALLRWQFQRILRAKSLELENVPLNRIPSSLGITFYQNEFLDTIRRFNYDSARKAYISLHEADLSLRGKMLDGRYIIENLVINLCTA